MPPQAKPVSSFLSASPHARMLGRVELGFGRSAAIWRNRDDHVTYDAPDGHTFSYYIRGGTGTWRTDAQPVHGWPGAVCIMPHRQSSVWKITRPFEFLHLYVPDEELRRSFTEMRDRDARLLDLADLTYMDAPELVAPFRMAFGAVRQGDSVLAETALSELLASVFADGRYSARRGAAMTGGLAPATMKRLRDYIETHLDQTIRLSDLARLAGLSDYHLHRGFRASCGVAPHQWITRRRVARAKLLICAGEPLAQVAAGCGFAGQSHLSRVFRRATGVTPAAYRSSLGVDRRAPADG